MNDAGVVSDQTRFLSRNEGVSRLLGRTSFTSSKQHNSNPALHAKELLFLVGNKDNGELLKYNLLQLAYKFNQVSAFQKSCVGPLTI